VTKLNTTGYATCKLQMKEMRSECSLNRRGILVKHGILQYNIKMKLEGIGYTRFSRLYTVMNIQVLV